MSTSVLVSADGDYKLPGNSHLNGFVTVSWPLASGTPDFGAASVQFFAVLVDPVAGVTLESPVDGPVITTGMLSDSTGLGLSSVNIYRYCDKLIARVSGFSTPFRLWVSP